MNFSVHLKDADLRRQVQALVPASFLMSDLGVSLSDDKLAVSAKARILSYLRKYWGRVIDGSELMVVAGISEYARRIRELRVEEGWAILSGNTAKELRKLKDIGVADEDIPPDMKPDEYLLLEDKQDRDAAHRWRVANRIRKQSTAAQDKILAFLRENIGHPVTSEELRYVANNKTEWARRTRELRTDEGWPIVTRLNGDPTLPVGVYVLERDEQLPKHDREIPELVRREVMERDKWTCRWKNCGWSNAKYANDKRYLEVHHIEHYAKGGTNDPQNLVTLCNLHHDQVHKTNKLDT